MSSENVTEWLARLAENDRNEQRLSEIRHEQKGTRLNNQSPSDAEIEDRFRYHPPTAAARLRHERITEASISFAKVIRDNVPYSRGQSAALSAVEEARMWANSGIACNHAKLEEK